MEVSLCTVYSYSVCYYRTHARDSFTSGTEVWIPISTEIRLLDVGRWLVTTANIWKFDFVGRTLPGNSTETHSLELFADTQTMNGLWIDSAFRQIQRKRKRSKEDIKWDAKLTSNNRQCKHWFAACVCTYERLSVKHKRNEQPNSLWKMKSEKLKKQKQRTNDARDGGKNCVGKE